MSTALLAQAVSRLELKNRVSAPGPIRAGAQTGPTRQFHRPPTAAMDRRSSVMRTADAQDRKTAEEAGSQRGAGCTWVVRRTFIEMIQDQDSDASSANKADNGLYAAALAPSRPGLPVSPDKGRPLTVKIHQRGVQWKQGVVAYIML